MCKKEKVDNRLLLTDEMITNLLNQLNEDYEKLCESLGIKPLEYY